MSGSQNGFYLKIKGKGLVKLLKAMFMNLDIMDDYFSLIDDEYIVVDLNNYYGQQCVASSNSLTESSDYTEVCQRLFEILYKINKEFVEKNQEKVKKAIANVKEIDWRYFDSCFEPWELELSDNMDGEEIGGIYSFYRFVYDSKKKKFGYDFQSETLAEGEFVEMKDFLYDCEDLQTFLKKNAHKAQEKLGLKTIEADYCKEIVKVGDDSSITVIIRTKPEKALWAEIKTCIDDKDWYFLLEYYDGVYWGAWSKSTIDAENRKCGNDGDYTDEDCDYFRGVETLFSIEVFPHEYLKKHIDMAGDYHDELYQIAKEELLKVAMEYGVEVDAE